MNIHFNCFLSMLDTAVLRYGKSALPYYLGHLGFYIIEPQVFTAADYDLEFDYMANLKVLKEQAGITVNYIEDIRDLDVAGRISENLKNGIQTGIVIDSYYVPWNRWQFSQHINHYLLVTGIKEGKYQFIDRFFGRESAEMDMGDVLPNVTSLVEFALSDPPAGETTLTSIHEILREAGQTLAKDHIMILEHFMEDYQKIRIEKQDISLTDAVENSSLVFSLSIVLGHRKLVLDILTLYGESFHTDHFAAICGILERLVSLWQVIVLFTTKCMLVADNKTIRGKVSDYMKQALSLENELIISLTEL